MADSAVVRLRKALSRLLDPAVSAPAPVSITLAAPSALRVVGNNAGLPAGQYGDKALATVGAIPLRGEAPTDYQRNGTTVRVRGFEQHPVVQACVRAIVDIASAVPLQVYRKTPARNATGFSDAVTVETSAHPLQALLDAPNSFMSAQRYRAFLLTHYCVYGNTLTYLERPQPQRPPASLRIIHPEDLTTVYINNKGYPVWYLWRDTLGYPHTSPVEDLLHVRDLNAKGLVFGFPRAAAALNDIIGDNEASQYVRQVVTNSGQPSGYALVNDETTAAEAKQAEEAFYEKMVTRGNRGRFAFVGGVKDIKSLAFNLRDLEFPDLRRVNREDICAAFGVDPRMVGITSASRDAGLSGTQYVEARVRLIKQTIEPLMRAIESEMNLWLAPEFGDVYVRFDPDVLTAMNEDKDTTSTRVRAEVAAGIRTIEEAREALDLNPAFDDDDTLAIPMGTQITPVLVALAPPPPPPDPALPPGSAPAGLLTAGTPAEDDADAEEPAVDVGTQTGKGAGDSEKDLQATTGTDPNDPGHPPHITDGAKDPKAKRSVALTNVVQTRSVKLSGAQRTTLWHAFDTRATNEEAAYKRQALVLFGEERASVKRVFEQAQAQADGGDETDHVAAVERTVKRMYKPQGDLALRWKDRFRPLIGETFAHGATHVEAAVNGGRSQTRARGGPQKGEHATTAPVVSYQFHLANPNVQAAIAGRAAALAEHVTKTTARTVTDAVALGIREGMRLSEIATLIDKTAFGSDASARAEMIARTETVGALNNGEITAAQDAGLEGKEWLTQGDDRVRDSHYMCEAEGMVPLDGEFPTGMQYPGDPNGDAGDVINCRCTLLYYDTLQDNAHSIADEG